jgi:rhodanese-related sulfurtransferase
LRRALAPIALGAALALGLPHVAGAEHPNTTWAPQTIDADRLKGLLDRGQRLVIVDVRSPDEFRQGHIPGAHSLSLDEPGDKFRELPRRDTIVLYCSCPMSEIGPAYQFLRYSGHTNVLVLRGGLAEWTGRGYGLVK